MILIYPDAFNASFVCDESQVKGSKLLLFHVKEELCFRMDAIDTTEKDSSKEKLPDLKFGADKGFKSKILWLDNKYSWTMHTEGFYQGTYAIDCLH